MFGTFDRLTERQRQSVLAYLDAAWRAQFGRSTGTLSVDLEALRVLYASAVTPARKLRALAGELQRIPLSRPLVDTCLFLPVDETRGFVTPEGRALLEVCAADTAGEDRLEEVLARLVDFYAVPRREWIADSLVGGDLRPATIGFVVFLLINGSTAESRALSIPAAANDEARLAASVIGVVNVFSVGIGHSPLEGPELTRLRSNWVVTEAGRQLPGVVVVTSGGDRARRPGPGGTGLPVTDGRKIYIGEGREGAAIEAAATALARRRGFTVQRLRDALRATLIAYREASPLLKNWDRSWETERHSAEVCRALEQAVAERLDA